MLWPKEKEKAEGVSKEKEKDGEQSKLPLFK